MFDPAPLHAVQGVGSTWKEESCDAVEESSEIAPFQYEFTDIPTWKERKLLCLSHQNCTFSQCTECQAYLKGNKVCLPKEGWPYITFFLFHKTDEYPSWTNVTLNVFGDHTHHKLTQLYL